MPSMDCNTVHGGVGVAVLGVEQIATKQRGSVGVAVLDVVRIAPRLPQWYCLQEIIQGGPNEAPAAERNAHTSCIATDRGMPPACNSPLISHQPIIWIVLAHVEWHTMS